MVNFNKSAICINKCASKKCYNSLLSILVVRTMLDDEKYLGNTPPVRKMMREINFDFLVSKIKSKIALWKAPLLSQVGQNVLIKYVASTIPGYNTSVLQLPKNITNIIDKSLGKF